MPSAASRTYDPSPKLEAITAPVLWINSADDFINPPELGIAEAQAKRLKNGTFVLLPISEKTRGHGSHTWAVLWKDRLAAFLKATEQLGGRRDALEAGTAYALSRPQSVVIPGEPGARRAQIRDRLRALERLRRCRIFALCARPG